MEEALKNILKNIPNKPGCYQFYDDKEIIIYVGKAKNLKNRVSSYFINKNQGTKTSVLVSKIKDIKYIVVNNESETLLLENNLIKKYKPKYNILLKDDKSYPSIVIKNEYFPRLFQTRRLIKDGSKYFGPYTNIRAMKAVLDSIRKLYKIRICSFDLSPEKINLGKYKVCLQYHIKKCEGPCVGYQSLDSYNKNIHAISEILKGNTKEIKDSLVEEMNTKAEELKFEEADKIKEQLLALQDYISKTTIEGNFNFNLDIYSYTEDEKSAYINFLNVRGGSVIQAFNFEYRKKLDENKEEILAMGIIEMRDRFKSNNKEIVVPFEPNFDDISMSDDFSITIPVKGEKRHLLQLSEKNVIQYKIDKLKITESLNPEQRQVRILKEIQKNLYLKDLPSHIECFDNSNLQGTNAVSSCVVFKMGKPSKKDYRIFNVKTVEGPDDYETMREVLTRRYFRLMAEESPLPQLIIIDGGKGQLGIGVEVLKALGLYGKIAVVGLAKRLEEIYFPDDPIPHYIDKNSDTLKVIQHLRDEAHRFGITRHRNRRSKAQIKTELDTIKGIGKETKMKLLKEFKSVVKIKETNFEDLEKTIGSARAKIIFEYFQTK